MVQLKSSLLAYTHRWRGHPQHIAPWSDRWRKSWHGKVKRPQWHVSRVTTTTAI